MDQKRCEIFQRGANVVCNLLKFYLKIKNNELDSVYGKEITFCRH